MNTPDRIRTTLAVGILLGGLSGLAAPAAADTTVADYLKLEKQEQAHLLGSMLQSLAEDFQEQKQEKNAECLVSLYTERSEARIARSPGMMDFLQSVEIAKENDPAKTTLEEIISRQLVQYCGYGRKK